MCVPGKISKQWKVGDIQLAEVRYEPLEVEPRHLHRSAHFYLGLDGGCIESVRDAELVHSRSTLGFLPAGGEHSFRYGPTGFKWFKVDLPPNWWVAINYPLSDPLVPIYCKDGPLLELLWKLYIEYCNPDDVSSLVVEALVVEMVSDLRRRKKIGDRVAPRWILQAQSFLDHHFRGRIELADVAKNVNKHPTHLAREFRRYFSCTIGEYIRMRRIECVRAELATTNRSLVEIALAAGFCDQSHFARSFKRTFGVTPTEYRNRI